MRKLRNEIKFAKQIECHGRSGSISLSKHRLILYASLLPQDILLFPVFLFHNEIECEMQDKTQNSLKGFV